MKIVLLASLVFSVLGCRQHEVPEDIEFIWRPDAISYEIRQDEQVLHIGQYLHLEQEIDEGESAWTMMVIDVPDHWIINELKMESGAIRLVTNDGQIFTLGADNIGKLNFDILDGGTKTDQELRKLWVLHAKNTG